MNPKEIILANLEHRNPSRPGLTFGSRSKINDMCSGGMELPQSYTQKRWTEGQYEYYDSMWGIIKRRKTDGLVGVRETFKPAIENWSQLKDYHPPEYDLEKTTDTFRQRFTADKRGRFKIVSMPGWVFSAAREIRKMENYLMDILLYPEEVKRLHTKVAGVFETLIRAGGKAGADGIFLLEDMGTQDGLLISPELWRENFRDLYRRLFGMAHEFGMKVLMHSCGQNREILEPLIDVGVDCFQFDQPTAYGLNDLANLFKKRKVALWSPIDIQKILPTGDRKLIENGVEDMFKHFEGFLIFKDYPGLESIGVKPEWDNWAYEKILQKIGGKK